MLEKMVDGGLFIGTVRLCVVGGGRHVSTTTSPVDVDMLACLVLLVGVFGLDQEGVGTEVITLSLKQVGGQILGAVTIEEGQSGAECRHRDTSLDSIRNNISPAFLSLVDSLVEEVVEEQVLKIRLRTVSSGDILEEDRSNNAATTPHERNGRLVQLPAVLLGSLRTCQPGKFQTRPSSTYSLHQHEALGVGDDLGGIKTLFKILEECSSVTGESRLGTAENLLGTSTFFLDRTQATSKDSLTNQSDGHTKIKRVDGCPFTSTLLTGRVEDLLDKWLAIIISVLEDITRDFDEEGVENAFVPLGELISHLLVAHSETTLHNIVCLNSHVSGKT